MDGPAVSHQLTRLGLSGYEARAYIALTGRDACTAAEVARLAGLPRQRIYDVLNSLVAKGLAATRPGYVLKYAATEPRVVIDRMVAAHRERLRDLELQATAIVDALTPAYRAGQLQTDPLAYIEVLRDAGAINTRFEELQASVRREILVFNKAPYATSPQDNVPGLRVARTHTARGMYEFALFDDPDATEGVKRFLQAGEEARFVPELPLKLAIIDETIVMFGMQDPVAGRSDLTIVVVEHPSLATALTMAFNAYWERGLSYDEADAQSVLARSQRQPPTIHG